jgi:hypothetical protein
MNYRLCLIVLLSIFIIGCEKSGEGNTAIYGLKCMYVIQDEIYKYRLENDKFPNDLSFLQSIEIPFGYELNKSNYSIKLLDIDKFCDIDYINYIEYFRLEYIYGPPGRNKIIYDNINKEWIIYGYY